MVAIFSFTSETRQMAKCKVCQLVWQTSNYGLLICIAYLMNFYVLAFLCDSWNCHSNYSHRVLLLTVISSAVSLHNPNASGFQRVSIPRTFFVPRSIIPHCWPLKCQSPGLKVSVAPSLSTSCLPLSLSPIPTPTQTNTRHESAPHKKPSEVAYDVPFKWENRPNHHSGSHREQYTDSQACNCIVYCNVKKCQHILWCGW